MTAWFAIACDHENRTMLIDSISDSRQKCLSEMTPECKIMPHRAFKFGDSLGPKLDAWFAELGFSPADRITMVRTFARKMAEAIDKSLKKDARESN